MNRSFRERYTAAERRLKFSNHREGGWRHTEEAKQKNREQHLNQVWSPESRAKISKIHKGRVHSEEHKQKVRESLLGRHYQPEESIRRAVGKRRRKWFGKSEEERRRITEYRLSRSLPACRRKPTKPEKRLSELFRELGLPYAYVGNGKLVINGFNPDFVNTNGQKKLVEVFGCFWHCCEACGKREWKRQETRERDARSLESYAEFGYGTLVIWQHELGNVERVKQKLFSFERRM